MKKMMNLFICVCFVTVSLGCNSKNSDLQASKEEFDYITVKVEQAPLTEPKVNVLFVVDNSGSMKGYQEKLSRNMQYFSKKFFANTRINYRIGVVPVYDSKYLNDQTVYKSGLRKMNALGELVPLKGLAANDRQEQLFITRETVNPARVLQETVAIGVQWGPEAEESFSPVLAITDEKINTDKNQGFYEKDAYLAVIFLTDADDVTPGLSGDEFYQRLIELKDGDRSKIFIAAALPNLNNRSDSCKTDGRGPLQAFPALLAKSGALHADLCSENFGAELALFGQYLVQRVAAQQIQLPFTPDITTLRVTYGTESSLESERVRIPAGKNGYFFDSENNKVLISSEFQIDRIPGGVIFVKAVPANLANYQNGRIIEL